MKTEPSKPKPANKKKILSVLAAILLACVLVASAWYFQQQRINDLTAQKAEVAKVESDTKKELELQKTANEQLKSQMNELNKKIKSLQNPERAKLALVVNEAKHSGNVINEQGNDLIYVDISITNTSQTLAGYFNQSDITLKDKVNNNIYPLCQNSPVGYYICRGGLSVPGGKTELISQTIPAGETIRGTVGFYAPKGLNAAKFSYDGVNSMLKIQTSLGDYN